MQANGMIFWDWNGTLMDDVDFTHSCLNWMLETHGYPQRYDLAAYREIFGFPIEEYYIRAGFNFAKHPYAELAERFMEHYNAGVDACPPSAHTGRAFAPGLAAECAFRLPPGLPDRAGSRTGPAGLFY